MRLGSVALISPERFPHIAAQIINQVACNVLSSPREAAAVCVFCLMMTAETCSASDEPPPLRDVRRNLCGGIPQ